MRNATTPLAPPAAHPALEDFGALYPLGAYWSVDEPDQEVGHADGGLDEEQLDEAIFAGMVAMR
jgi:hypothetical protein